MSKSPAVPVSEYGKPLPGKTTVITCGKRGCKVKRTIKVQDAFQVKFCVEHQKEAAREKARARRKAKRDAEGTKASMRAVAA